MKKYFKYEISASRSSEIMETAQCSLSPKQTLNCPITHAARAASCLVIKSNNPRNTFQETAQLPPPNKKNMGCWHRWYRGLRLGLRRAEPLYKSDLTGFSFQVTARLAARRVASWSGLVAGVQSLGQWLRPRAPEVHIPRPEGDGEGRY